MSSYYSPQIVYYGIFIYLFIQFTKNTIDVYGTTYNKTKIHINTYQDGNITRNENSVH